ncbi:MAG: hypothetical protein CBC25_08450 [Pelagibacteraceae bacterium TMED65]|nr:hypothetical protein [Rickettsiales bacterium]OUU50292.1 MAG: hypothetical protein CBC25_08450 [Pelagibacteraceae bacterium TMED65]
MQIKYLKIEGEYIFLRGSKNILTPNGNKLKVCKRRHAELVVQELNKQKENKNPNSLLNLTLFSCNLNISEKNLIKNKILEILEFDCILCRFFDDNKLIKKMDRELNSYIKSFEEKFHTKLKKIESLLQKSTIHNLLFKEFLDQLNRFDLTVFYKLSILTKSSILSYFFIKNKIDHNTLYKLANIEYTYQQKEWGLTDDQKKINNYDIRMLKNISFFFKNIN